MTDRTEDAERLIAEDAGPGPLSLLCDKEWQDLLDKSDRTSPAEYPDMILIARNEFGGAMREAYLLARQKAEPNPEWEAIANAAHAATIAEHGVQPAETLNMLKHWKADAEPANHLGQVSFSRALLDSATDALSATFTDLTTEIEARKVAERERDELREANAPVDETSHMERIGSLIERMQKTKDSFGNTCVYIRRGGLSWGAVALNRQSDDKKHGVFDLQAQHDRDMTARVEQVQRLIDRQNEQRTARAEAEKRAEAAERALVEERAKVEAMREALTKIAASDPETYDECCGGGVQVAFDEPPECCAQPIRENAGRVIASAALASPAPDAAKEASDA